MFKLVETVYLRNGQNGQQKSNTVLQIIQNILKEKLYKWSLTMHIFIIRFIVDDI